METATATQAEQSSSFVLTPAEITHYRRNPVHFVRKAFNADPDEQQCQFLMAVANSSSTAAKSGHGTGKTTVFAWLVMWFLYLWDESRVVATAPTQRQLLDILWPEIRKWLDRSVLVDFMQWQATRIVVNGCEETWFATARTSNKPENIQGFHAQHLLILVDEASGVPQPTMEAIEGALTTAGTRIVLGGNPTRLYGTFFDAFHKMRAFYRTLTMSSERSRNVTREYCERLAAKYGRDSDVYLVRVLGEFPRSEPDVLIHLDAVEDAINREDADRTGTIEIGCDPAWYGDCETVIMWREGYYVHDPIAKQGINTQWCAGEIVRLAKRIHKELLYTPRIAVKIDVTGIGAGVYDALMTERDAAWIDPIAVNFGGAGDDENEDTATVLLAGIKEALPMCRLPDDDDLVAQLTTRKYRLAKNGKVKIESKDELRARKLPSPDRGDALGLAFYSKRSRILDQSVRAGLAERYRRGGRG